jgi:hypothetical protein
LIDRGLRSDEAWPEGKAYLMNTSDSGRNVRAETYERVKAVLGPAYPIEQVDADALEGKSDIMFEFTGVARVAAMTSNRFLDGAMADHLTSWGGGLIGYDQTTALDWLAAGATGSYGTTTEPCSFRAKFPDVGVAMAHYLMGETLIEAYWKSVSCRARVSSSAIRWRGRSAASRQPLGRGHRDLDARAAAGQLPLRGGAQQHRAVPGDPRRSLSRLRRSPVHVARGRHALLPRAQRADTGAAGVGCGTGVRSSGGRGAELTPRIAVRSALLGLDAERDDDARHHVVRRDRSDQLDEKSIVAECVSRRCESRVGDFDRARHLEREPDRRAFAGIEQTGGRERAIDVVERVDLRVGRAGGAQQRRVVMEFVGRAVDRRDDADGDLAQAVGQLEAGPHRAHQRVPAERERRAVEQLAVEIEQPAAAAGEDRRNDLRRAGVVVRLVGQSGHEDAVGGDALRRPWRARRPVRE